MSRTCDQRTSTTTNAVGDTAYSSQLQRTILDVDDRAGRTQIFGGKASEPETTRPVEKKRNFTYPTCIWHLLGVMIPWEFHRDLLFHKTMQWMARRVS